jgi:hypothetical protein
LGLLHLRLQTWFPFTLQVCMNGREWLARQMTAAGLGFRQQDNCFVEVEDCARAQALFDQQLRVNWNSMMNRLTRTYHPTHRRLFAEYPIPYYWSADESEWATDVLFRSPDALASLFPGLIRHALLDLKSADVMRFLGRRMPKHGGLNGNFQGEVVTDVKTRPEGTRVKHRLNRNSIKMYDKQATILRVETTINDAHDLKVYRKAEGQPKSKLRWRPLRKGVADLFRRARLSQAANERYLQNLAATGRDQTLGELTTRLCQPGEWQSGAVTRRIRLLRAHGLILKVPKTQRYQLTAHGQLAIAALLQAQKASAAQLQKLAA